MIKLSRWAYLGSMLLLLISQHPVQAEQTEMSSIKLAAENNWAPFADHDGQGLSHTLINEAFAREGINVDSIVVSYARGVVMAQQGAVDGVFNLHKEQANQDKFIFGNEPLFSASAYFYQNNSHPLNVNSKWDIPKNSIVGIIRGYDYGDELKSLTQLKFIEVDNHHQLINLLLLNRIDTAIMYEKVANQYLTTMGVTHVINKSVHNHTGDLYLAFSQSRPHSKLFAEKLDQGIRALKSDGRYQQIMSSLAIEKQQYTTY
ncbi:transporter substrate-binding domain-containing protein [Shewanella sp. Isolate11]|uniref:substrate-binding periplasmic protein n=1 Tax=Shewanella sp. Isolate11 TaxID=2908530 RepID=UPI001EFCECBA|nr:transporter substrate-binding domain-containing protein [Shewanella sp. Isolate11]MCG9697285.1 transporter substrate-binding domain-containing protein [Shewanella sp. Isolate11]